MLTIIEIINKITETIKLYEEELNYDLWHVAVSPKNINLFKYDTQIALRNVTEIDNIYRNASIEDEGFLEELKESLTTMGIDCIIDTPPLFVYLYKTLI